MTDDLLLEERPRTPLSDGEALLRRPLPPEILASAIADHPLPVGRGRPARTAQRPEGGDDD
jgi:hypothetical protein